MDVRFKGDANLRRALAALKGAARKEAQAHGLEAGARIVETWAKVYAPVDTGHLRSSIAVDEPVTPKLASVSAAAEYAEYVEIGTGQAAAQPFLRPALDQHEAEITAAVSAEIRAFVLSVRGM